MEPLDLYRHMVRARAFELAIGKLWTEGLISGEMHLGTGEEAVAAGVVSHLGDRDALALDHRSTPPMVVLGVPLVPILLELLGRPDGLCGGRGGHMHLFSAPHLTASSGIVGSSAPLAVGFALAAQRLRPGHVAVAFFGDGAMNQGMVLESINLAAVWNLPVLFVCKANGWAVTTRCTDVTRGDLLVRAQGLGADTFEVDGLDVVAVHDRAGTALAHVRAGHGPAFLLAHCSRLDGHFLGDPLVRTADNPLTHGRALLGGVVGAALTGGGEGLSARARSMAGMMGTMARARTGRSGSSDPVHLARNLGTSDELDTIAVEAQAEIDGAVAEALGEVVIA